MINSLIRYPLPRSWTSVLFYHYSKLTIYIEVLLKMLSLRDPIETFEWCSLFSILCLYLRGSGGILEHGRVSRWYIGHNSPNPNAIPCLSLPKSSSPSISTVKFGKQSIYWVESQVHSTSVIGERREGKQDPIVLFCIVTHFSPLIVESRLEGRPRF